MSVSKNGRTGHSNPSFISEVARTPMANSWTHMQSRLSKLTHFSDELFCDCPVSAVSGDALEPSGLVSPSSTVRSLTKELQHSLDLASATSGDKVVTAQVSEAADQTFPLML